MYKSGGILMRKVLAGLLLGMLLMALITGLYGRYVKHVNEPAPTPTPVATVAPTPTPTPTPEPTPEPEPTIDPAVFTDTDSLLLVANKVHKLPEGYEPADLVNANDYGARGSLAPYMRLEAAQALGEMTAAAERDGVWLSFSSAYRSESYQAQLYNNYVIKWGAETADTISSRPGYSDHQTGLALDFIEGTDADFNEVFEDTASGNWLREHAHEYGFIMRYPKGKDAITGYAYEPWHFRYIGVDYATAIWEVDQFCSFEEYFGVEGGTTYKE